MDDAASVGGALWVSYLFVLFYLAVAAGAVTHADLFFEKPVKLPFLGVELPLFWFFVLAPFLFVIVHAYALVHLVMLTNKAKRFDEELRKRDSQEDGYFEREGGVHPRRPQTAIAEQHLRPVPRRRAGSACRLVRTSAARDRLDDACRWTGSC